MDRDVGRAVPRDNVIGLVGRSNVPLALPSKACAGGARCACCAGRARSPDWPRGPGKPRLALSTRSSNSALRSGRPRSPNGSCGARVALNALFALRPRSPNGSSRASYALIALRSCRTSRTSRPRGASRSLSTGSTYRALITLTPLRAGRTLNTLRAGGPRWTSLALNSLIPLWSGRPRCPNIALRAGCSDGTFSTRRSRRARASLRSRRSGRTLQSGRARWAGGANGNPKIPRAARTWRFTGNGCVGNPA